MTKFKKFLGLGLVLAMFAIAGAVPAFAQCDDVNGYTDMYNKILASYEKRDIPSRELTVATSKEYLEKYGSCPAAADGTAHPAKDGVNWVKAQLPDWEKRLKALKDAEVIERLYKKYNSELGANKWDDAIATSKDLLAVFPADKSLNIIIPLASIGLYESYKKNDKYVDISLKNAKIALDKMNAGEVALKDYYGIAPYIYGNKVDAMSEMKFILGYLSITNAKKGDKKGGLTYLYDVAQSSGLKKTEPRLFVTIGQYYLDQAAKIGEEIAPMVKEINAADEEIKKPGTTPELITELNKKKIDLNNQINAKDAYYKAWEERAIDAFSRAHKSVGDVTPDEKKYRKIIYDQIAKIYESRFGNNKGVDTYMAASVAKPLPNPTSDVTPVVIETTGGAGVAIVTKPVEPTKTTVDAKTTVATKTTDTVSKTTAKTTVSTKTTVVKTAPVKTKTKIKAKAVATKPKS